jgi:FAD/FMN-containing dehydrogenase
MYFGGSVANARSLQVKYGVTKHYLLGLEVVLATEIVKLGGKKDRMAVR